MKPPLFLSVIWISFIYITHATSQIIINEFMADNITTFADMCDYDDFSDWIELYNTSSETVDLTGYYLTDNLDNPDKWAIPNGTTLPSHGYLLIHADGFDAQPGDTDVRNSYPWNDEFTVRRYHANFKLSATGEEIGLYRIESSNGTPGITTVDTVTFSHQSADISMGRQSGTTRSWAYFDQPTPGTENSSRSINHERGSGAVSFSLPGGFYDNAQTVELTTASGTVYYTIDGSIPNAESIVSMVYSSPLIISGNTVIRARCIEPDRRIGPVTTNTYFIGEKKRTLMMASITTDNDLLYDRTIGVFENSLKKREIPITLELFTTDGRQVVKVNAGMTLGSLTNFTCPQKPLQIACKGSKYGDDEIWYQLFSKDIACFPRIRMRQGGDAWETNLIADGTLEAMQKGQLDFGIQAYRPVVLFINGQYYGIQDMREQFDDQYFINNYNVDPTTKDEMKTTMARSGRSASEQWTIESGTRDEYDELLSLVQSGEMNNEKYMQIKESVNINSFIDFISAVVFASQISWGHNQDLWKVENSKWQWLVTDFDRCYESGSFMRSEDLNLFTSSGGASRAIVDQDTLFKNLITNNEFKGYFTQRFAAHLNSTFHPARMTRIVDSLAALLAPEMEEYIEKWGSESDLRTVSDWEEEIDKVKDFLATRPDYCFEYFKERPFNYSGTVTLSIAVSGKNGGDIHINGVRMCGGTDSLRFVTGIPITVTAVAKPGYVFTGWGTSKNIDPLTFIPEDDTSIIATFETAQEHPVPSSITEDLVLNLTDNAYVVSGDIVVEKGATLTIEKGVTLLMAQDADILVKGKLLVHGTADAQVTIKPHKAAGAKNWGALTFENATDTNRIVYATILGTTLGNDPLNERAGINGNHSQVIMEHINISESIYPFYCEYGHTVLRNSHIIIDHICNGGIHVGRGSAVVDNNIWISTGKTINTDAIDIKGVTTAMIRGNRLYNFNGINSDGIDLGERAVNVVVENNYIYGNRDKGISVGGASECIVRNNIIVECDKGIGIKDSGSVAMLDHNVFSRNRIAIATYSKAYGRGGGTAIVTNCILSSSKSSSVYTDDNSTIQLSYCVSDVDILPGASNLFSDPGFIDELNNNFQLAGYSACINAGQPEFAVDSDGSRTDIGAQYTFAALDFPPEQVPAAIPPPVIFSEIMYNGDNDYRSGDWMELYNTTDSDIALAGWKCTDKIDYDFWEPQLTLSDIDSSDIFHFPSGAVIPKGGYVVLCKNITAFKEENGNLPHLYGPLPFGIDGKENILLYNDSDELVSSLCYTSKKPWPKKPDGNGPSLELIHANRLNYVPLNWAASRKYGGTPGAANTASSVRHTPATAALPTAFNLARSFPNPCRTAATINFTLPQQTNVTLSVYNLSGKRLATLVNSRLTAGRHTVMLDAKSYSPGIYFYRIESPKFIQTRKITIQ